MSYRLGLDRHVRRDTTSVYGLTIRPVEAGDGEPQHAAAREIVQRYPKAVAISSTRGDGILDLLRLIQQELYESLVPVHVRLPYQQGALISLFHEAGQVDRLEHQRGAVVMQGRVPGRLLAQFTPWSLVNARGAEQSGAAPAADEPLEEE